MCFGDQQLAVINRENKCVIEQKGGEVYYILFMGRERGCLGVDVGIPINSCVCSLAVSLLSTFS